MGDEKPTISDLLDAAGHLPEDGGLDAVRAWLDSLRESLIGANPRLRALAREATVNRLGEVEEVSSPARLTDAFINGARPETDSDLRGSRVAHQEPEPWPDEVDGAALLDALTGILERYLALPDGAATAVALWVLHAHAHAASPISPVLAITSPEKRCGKTTLLELLSAVVPRPLPASNVTAATVFRAVEAWRPTLLVDEANTFIRGSEELRGVLDSGHRRSMAYVPRCVGDDHEVKQFRTWAPKAVALIGDLPDTLSDRSVEIRMRRRAPDEEVERLRLDRLEELEPLRRRAWTWAHEHEDALERAEPSLSDGLHDRERDNWRPLVAIADAAGGPWPDRAREAACLLSEDGPDERSLGTRLLADVRSIFEDRGLRAENDPPSDRIRSKALVKALCDLEEAPWSEYKGRGLSPVSLANFLKSFDISSKQLRFGESGSYKGYKVEAFKDAFRRYLPEDDPEKDGGADPSPSEDPLPKAKHPKQSPSDKGPDGFLSRNIRGEVLPSESLGHPDTTGNVSDVSGHEGEREEGDSPEEDPLAKFDSATGLLSEL